MTFLRECFSVFFSPFFFPLFLRRASPAKRGVYTERSEVRVRIAELAERSEAYRFSNIAMVRDRREAAGALEH